MDLFADGKLRLQVFDEDVRRGTHELADVLLAAARTQSNRVESTHFLMALARIDGGETQQHLNEVVVTVEEWQSVLGEAALRSVGTLPPAHLTRASLHPTAEKMLDAAREVCQQKEIARINERVLLHCGLQNLTEEVARCLAGGIDVVEWIEKLRKRIWPPPPLVVYADDGTLMLATFSARANKVLRLLRTEAESLGFTAADPRHLLLALASVEGGAAQYGLHLQGLTPRKVQEAVLLTLRARARRTASEVPPDRTHHQPSLQHIFMRAAELAGGLGAAKITEPLLFAAFLDVESTARNLLADQKLDLVALRKMAEEFQAAEEDEEDKDTGLADAQTVQQRLRDRLVGQDEAIDQIVPYLELMRFDFTEPGRPVGVFLFCGQSGSGKTEMAKELARAVYGTEENLIFLEMGQFNSPESMNIFVGAPPGYVGFGQGKLTNGLRDKPRSVVLFDEMEKADPKVLDALLRFLDEGKIDDPAGQVRDGSQCLLILTSNVGQDKLSQLGARDGRGPGWRTEVRKVLREEFKMRNIRPEFLNRLDEIPLFNTLREKDYIEIAHRHLKRIAERFRTRRRLELEFDDSTATAIGGYCSHVQEGARAVPRLTKSVVILPVIRYVQQQAGQSPGRLKVWATWMKDEPDSEPAGVVEPLD